MPEKTALRGSSGLKDDFDGVIKSVEFGYDSTYQDGNVLLALAEIEPADGEDMGVSLWSIGSGWTEVDKGQRAVREDTGEPAPNGFNKQSTYQIVINALLDMPEAEKILDTRADADVWPWDAAFLVGLNCHWNRVTMKIMGEDRERLVPTAFLGLDGQVVKKPAVKTPRKATTTVPKTGGKVPTAAERAAAAKAKAEAAKAAEEGGDETDDDPVLVQMAEIAREAEDFDQFMERCYSELDDPDAYEAYIVDDTSEGVYESARA